MKLELTDLVTGRLLIVDDSEIKILEDNYDSATGVINGSHIVFGPSMGRAVKQLVSDIKAVLGVVKIP
jgi:hypothetical protein